MKKKIEDGITDNDIKQLYKVLDKVADTLPSDDKTVNITITQDQFWALHGLISGQMIERKLIR